MILLKLRLNIQMQNTYMHSSSRLRKAPKNQQNKYSMAQFILFYKTARIKIVELKFIMSNMILLPSWHHSNRLSQINYMLAGKYRENANIYSTGKSTSQHSKQIMIYTA